MLTNAALQTRAVERPPADTTPLLPRSRENYSVFTTIQKRTIILAAALASSFSPFSANIYYPSLNSIAADLHVTPSQINLTITTYMIFQGLAPAFMGSFADQAGRRPAYILCFAIYIAGNIALALQHSYAALLVLRAVQSCGSSGTVALASAVAADIITSAERGMYMGVASLGNILAPSLGPIVGGLLSQYLGWQAIFWFLAAAAAAFSLPLLVFFPETCRAIVGDGSIRPRGWNQSFWSYWKGQRQFIETGNDQDTSKPRVQLPNPLSTLRLLFCLPTGFVLLANGVIFASYYSVTTGIPSKFKELYGLDDLGIGLSFIPAGVGSLFSATFTGMLVDWNYRRLRSKSGDSVTKDRHKQDFTRFPVEQARLQIGLPLMITAATSVAIYGWAISTRPPLLAILMLVFIISFSVTSAYNVLNILVVDLHYSTPATAMAANNLIRCFLGAGATAAVRPMILQHGSLWTYLAVATVMVSVSPLLGVVYWKGMAWRHETAG